MAGYQALAAVGTSIVALLQRRFNEVPAAGAVSAFLASASELATLKRHNGSLIAPPAVGVYCYRVSVDKETRPGWSAVASTDLTPRIPLRMHFLLSTWADDARSELMLLGLAARILESDGILTGPVLDPTGEWQPGDAVQIVTDDLALDTMSEAFQALSTEFRLTMPYIARVICIDGPREVGGERISLVADRSVWVDR